MCVCVFFCCCCFFVDVFIYLFIYFFFLFFFFCVCVGGGVVTCNAFHIGRLCSLIVVLPENLYYFAFIAIL